MNKWTKGAWIRAGLALAASAASLPGMAHEPCGLDTLHGLYMFSATGFTMPQGAALPKAITEMIRFNGDGTLTVLASTHSINGVVARSAPGGTGTYSLDSTCVGTLQFTNGPGFDVFVAPKDDGLWMIQTDPANVLQGRVTRMSR